MNNYFVILAAGKGKRFNKNKPKQFHQYKNREVIEHSIIKLIRKYLKLINIVNYFDLIQ